MMQKILKQLAYLDFEVLAYTMKRNNAKSVAALAEKLMECYTADDVNRIFDDLLYAYENRQK